MNAYALRYASKMMYQIKVGVVILLIGYGIWWLFK